MKAGVCGQHTRRARGAAVAPASGFGPPRGSVAVASRHTQGKVVAKFPHPSRIKTRIDLATPRKRARELRTSKLGHRSSRRIAVVAQFPAGAPAATSTHIQHHRHATNVHRAAQLVTKHRRGHSPTFSASGQLCRAPAVSQEHVEYQAPRPVLGRHSGPDPAEHVQHSPHNTVTTKRSAPPRWEGPSIAALPRCDSVRRLRMEAACSTADERALHRSAGRGGCRLGRSQSEGGRVGETKATDGWLWDQTRFLRSRTICDGAAVTDIGVAVSVLGSAARRAGHLYPGLRLTLPPRFRAGGKQ